MMNQADFYQGWKRMEEEGDAEPLSPALEERLMRAALAAQRPRWRRRWPVLAGVSGLALAACLLLFLWPQPAGWRLVVAPDETALGSAASEPATGEQTTLTGHSLLRMTLRPHEPTVARPWVRAYLRRDGGALSAWDVRLVPGAKGTFQLRAPLQDLGLSPGRYELVFAIGAQGAGPEPPAVEEALRHQPPRTIAGWQVLRHALQVRPVP